MIRGVHHIQITIPRGAEDIGRAFYCGVLGLQEVPKPVELQARGGFWLRAGGQQVHVGTEDAVNRAATKAHLAYEVCGIEAWRARLATEGISAADNAPIPGFERFEFRDPFGNRVELIEPVGTENGLTLEKTAPGDITPLYAILLLCGEELHRRHGLDHWYPPYPLEKMRENAEAGDVFAVRRNGRLLGTFTLGSSWKYDGAAWANPSAPALYLGKLAVLPFAQGQGLGTWCLRQAERIGRERGRAAVRFDAITRHDALCGFYRKQGYAERGTMVVTDSLQRAWDVTLFEKELATRQAEAAG